MGIVAIEDVSAPRLEAGLAAYAGLLHACVHAGASINFVMPFPMAEAEAFWTRKVLPALKGGGLFLLAAKVDGALAGSLQLDHDMPPNQRHRAELRKMIVHPDFRRRGIARALIEEAECRARAAGRSLITLDTRTGDFAEPLYASMGFETAGIIPAYARDVFEERLDDCTFMYKRLRVCVMPPAALILLALAAGALLAAQGPILNRLAVHAGGPLQAAIVAFAIGIAALVAVAFASGAPLPRPAAILRMPLWLWASGLIGTALLLLTLHAVPRIGVAAFTACVVCGQMVAALAYDHFGLLGIAARQAGPRELLAVALLGGGVALLAMR